MSLRIGLIGGIACGKSTALKYFKSQGIDTFSADEIARSLTQKSSPCFQMIKEYCGNECLLENGEIDRSYLRQRLLQEPAFKDWLESLLHPIIQNTLISLMNQSKTPYCVVEIPLLKNKNTYHLDRVLYIKAPSSEQTARLISRGLPNQHIEGMLKAQITENIREQLADDIIENNEKLTDFYKNLTKLHQYYLTLK